MKSPRVVLSPPGANLRALALATTVLASTASAAVVDISGNLSTTLNDTVGAGNSARLIANAKTYWQSTTNAINVDLNGFEFYIDNGGGNAHTYNGAITGPGTLAFRGRPNGGPALDMRLGGSVANTPDSVLLVRGSISLNKTVGVDALAGPITINAISSETARIRWERSDQINDDSTITATASAGPASLELGAFSETIYGLTIKSGQVVNTAAGGVLTVTNLTVDGVVKPPGTYTSADGFVTGAGSVVVPPPSPPADANLSTIDASTTPVVANGIAEATVTVTLKNANNDPASGKVVTLSSSRGGVDVISPASVLSKSSGVVTFSVKSLAAGTPVFTATATDTVGSVTLVPTASVTFTANAAADTTQSTVVASSGSIEADGSPNGTVTVTLKDGSGAPLPGKTVTLASSRGTADFITTSSSLSNAAGVVTFQVGSLTVGTPVFTATVVEDSATVSQTATLTFIAATNVVDVSNDLTPFKPASPAEGVVINTVVEAGKSARLVGLTRTYWGSGGFARMVNLNENELIIGTGGNTFTVDGAIVGNGVVTINAGGIGVLSLGGNVGNSYTGTTTVTLGPVKLQKSVGNALSGSISVTGGFSNNFPTTGSLWWGANNQINDTSDLTLGTEASLNPDGYSDTVGTLTVTGDANLILGGTTSVLRFADSSATTWTTGKQLIIRGWNGSLTGAGTERVVFGNSTSGLSTAQVDSIGFMDPAGLPAGLYRAQILTDGEVVPTGSKVEAISPPYDLSPSAVAAREAIYTSTGRADLTAAGTPLEDGTRIVLFGDSITWQNNYINLINTAIANGAGTQGKTITLVNRGINGGGVIQIRDGAPNSGYPGNSAQASFASLIASDDADIAVVYIGINDVNWRNTDIADYEQGLRDIAASAATQGVKLVFVTPAANNESPFGADPKDPRIDDFSAVVEEVASDTGATFVNLRAAVKAYWQNNNVEIRLDGTLVALKQYGLLTYDGIHPTALGNALIADHISAGILASLTTSASPTFSDWSADNAGSQAADQDYDGDGVPNGVEYFMGETGATFTTTPQVVTTAGVRTVTWTRDPSVTVPFKVQTSEDLETWTDYTVPNAAIDESDPGQIVFTLPESATKLFVRLVVTPPDAP